MSVGDPTTSPNCCGAALFPGRTHILYAPGVAGPLVSTSYECSVPGVTAAENTAVGAPAAGASAVPVHAVPVATKITSSATSSPSPLSVSTPVSAAPCTGTAPGTNPDGVTTVTSPALAVARSKNRSAAPLPSRTHSLKAVAPPAPAAVMLTSTFAAVALLPPAITALLPATPPLAALHELAAAISAKLSRLASRDCPLTTMRFALPSAMMRLWSRLATLTAQRTPHHPSGQRASAPPPHAHARRGTGRASTREKTTNKERKGNTERRRNTERKGNTEREEEERKEREKRNKEAEKEGTGARTDQQ